MPAKAGIQSFLSCKGQAGSPAFAGDDNRIPSEAFTKRNGRDKPGHDETFSVIARSEATKQSRSGMLGASLTGIASLRSQ
jgi:hypothetical protein